MCEVGVSFCFGRLFFGNEGGVIFFNIFAMSMNTLVYLLPYFRLGMFDFGSERMLSMSAAVCCR